MERYIFVYIVILYMHFLSLYSYVLTLELPIVNTKLFLPKPVKMSLKNT